MYLFYCLPFLSQDQASTTLIPVRPTCKKQGKKKRRPAYCNLNAQVIISPDIISNGAVMETGCNADVQMVGFK
jgi:hypothetical protein